MPPHKSVCISTPVQVLCKASWLKHVMLTLFSLIWSEICKRMLCIYLFTPKLKWTSYCNRLPSVNDAFLKRGGGKNTTIHFLQSLRRLFFLHFFFPGPCEAWQILFHTGRMGAWELSLPAVFSLSFWTKVEAPMALFFILNLMDSFLQVFIYW